MNLNIRTTLSRAVDQIRDNYEMYSANVDKLPHDANITEQFHLERLEYNKQNEIMQEMVKDTIETSANLLRQANKLEEENKVISKNLKDEK